LIEAGEHVTVLGWEKTTAVESQTTFETEWVHVFTVREGKITRWRGFFDTAARYRVAAAGPPQISIRNAHPDV
jgi:ketosteroid isomerase-like protein